LFDFKMDGQGKRFQSFGPLDFRPDAPCAGDHVVSTHHPPLSGESCRGLCPDGSANQKLSRNGLRGDRQCEPTPGTAFPPSRRIIKGRPFEVGFECEAELYRKEHTYEH